MTSVEMQKIVVEALANKIYRAKRQRDKQSEPESIDIEARIAKRIESFEKRLRKQYAENPPGASRVDWDERISELEEQHSIESAKYDEMLSAQGSIAAEQSV